MAKKKKTTEKGSRKITQLVERLAEHGGALSHTDIERVTGWGRQGVDLILTHASVIPWVIITRPDGKYQFAIDQPLRNLCDAHAARPALGGETLKQFLATLRREIAVRRK